MSNLENYNGLNNFGSDVKEARKKLKLSRSALAEKIGIDPRYLANIENSGSLPSLLIFSQLVRICRLPVSRYFMPEYDSCNDGEIQRICHKVIIIKDKYRPLIELLLDELLNMEEVTIENREW